MTVVITVTARQTPSLAQSLPLNQDRQWHLSIYLGESTVHGVVRCCGIKSAKVKQATWKAKYMVP
jgi:hypothetical protein